MRAKFRKNPEKPEPLIPNEVNEVRLNLNDLNHTFRAGHKIMVQIQSTWFPLVNLNPQKFLNIYNAKPEDYQKARIKIFHSARYPSVIRYQELKK